MHRYVIIGSGVAGVAAIEAIRSQDRTGEITLIGDEADGFYSRPGLAYLLTGEITEDQLFLHGQRRFGELNVRHLHNRVTRIFPAEHRVSLHQGPSLPYDRLLIATGAFALMPDLPGVNMEGVVKLENLDDARRILKLARKRCTAVVVGGGITALEIVEGLVKRGVKTHYFLRGERYWSNVLDDTESKIVERRLHEEGVIIHYNTSVQEILGQGGRICAVRCNDGQILKCEILGIAIGISPRARLAKDAGLRVGQGIIVDEYLQTSAPGVFAAGDVAEVYDPLSGKTVVDSLWGPAREQGHYAGLNMAGISKPYIKRIAFNVTRLANLTTTIIGTVGRGSDLDLYGIARGDSEVWRQLPDAIAAQCGFEVNRLRILVGEKTLFGAILMGDQSLSRAIHNLVYHQVDITPIRALLLKPPVALNDVIVDFWTSWRASHAEAF